jgi:hypothetical protein
MRSEVEVRENLEWLRRQCVHFKEVEADRIVRQLEVLLWVLGHERAEAAEMADAIWLDARSTRRDSPRDYS